MRRLAFFGATAFVLIACNVLIVQKEALKSSNQTVFLKLAPIEFRRIVPMSDSMTLNYDITMTLNYDITSQSRGAGTGEGLIVVSLDERRVASFVRVYSGEPLATNERLLKFQNRQGWLQIGPQEYYFQEGQSDLYSHAQYGELRVNAGGDCLLIGLCDINLQRLGRQ